MPVGELVAGANVECDYSLLQHQLQFTCRNRGQFAEVGERGRALAINFGILQKVFGTGWQVGGQLPNEFFPAPDLQRVVSEPFGTDS